MSKHCRDWSPDAEPEDPPAPTGERCGHAVSFLRRQRRKAAKARFAAAQIWEFDPADLAWPVNPKE
jgi:hypothetical protein